MVLNRRRVWAHCVECNAQYWLCEGCLVEETVEHVRLQCELCDFDRERLAETKGSGRLAGLWNGWGGQGVWVYCG